MLDKEFLTEALNYHKILAENTKNIVDFELAKMGIPHDMSDDEVRSKVLTIEENEAKTFWGNVRDNPEEVIHAIRYLEYTTNISRFKEKLTPNQQEDYKRLIEKIKSATKSTFSEEELEHAIKYEKSQSDFLKNNPSQFSKVLKKLFEKNKDLKFNQLEIKQNFEKVMKLLQLPHTVEINTDVSSIYDGPKSLKFPKYIENISYVIVL